jgi:hypothetical protein
MRLKPIVTLSTPSPFGFVRVLMMAEVTQILSLRFDGHTVYAVLITFIQFLKQFNDSDGYIKKCFWFSEGGKMLTEF